MTMDDITARPVGLDNLLDGIGHGTVVLPEFQRDFDWGKPAVMSLLATVLRGWPAGSLLVMKGAPDYFATRPFEDAPPAAARVDYVVLDGQQRLTSLYHALRGAGPTVYAINVSRLEDPDPTVDDIEEAITSMPREQWAEEWPLRAQAREAVVPLYALSGATSFFEWRDAAVDAVPTADQASRRQLLTRAYKNLLGRANLYAFPSVVLETSLPPEAVARIFERVNRTGLRLGTFDLLVARTYERSWNLRDKWDDARRDSDHLEAHLAEDGTPVLQTIALRYASDVRQPAILTLSKQLVHEKWDAAAAAYDQALGFLSDTCQIDGPDWLPYRAQVLPLAALALEHDLDDHRDALVPWFWARAFGQDYDVASSTRAVADYTKLRDALRGGPPPDPSTVNVDHLAAATRRQSGALYRAFVTLLRANGAQDPLTGRRPAVPTPSPALRQRRGERDSPHLRALNHVLVERTTARGRTAPLAELFDDAPDAADSQLLPRRPGDLGAEELLRARAELVADYLAQQHGSLIRIARDDPGAGH